jgi:hypothetical protein
MRRFIVFWWVMAALIPLTWIGQSDGPSVGFLILFYIFGAAVTSILWFVAGFILKIAGKG